MLLVRRVRLLLLATAAASGMAPAPLPGAPGQGSKEGCRQSQQPQGARLCCSHSCGVSTAPVSTASGPGWAPADGAPLRSCLCPAIGRGLARAIHAADRGRGSVAGRGGAPRGAQICQFVEQGEMSRPDKRTHFPTCTPRHDAQGEKS